VRTLNDLPIDEDLALSDLGRSLMLIRGAPLAIGRPYAVRPGTPPERVAILRDALAKLVADPQFLSESNAAQIEMEHITADEVAKRFNAMISQPPEAIGRCTRPSSLRIDNSPPFAIRFGCEAAGLQPRRHSIAPKGLVHETTVAEAHNHALTAFMILL
jgi:hypothetical protein